MTEPLVSVGIPTYNRDEFLPRALDRLLSQTHENLEIIVSDNASNDDTPEICRDYEDKDPRVRYVRQETNRGPVENYAEVLRRASGKYFMWHADDDYFDLTFVEKAIEVLESDEDVALCFCDYRFIDESGEKTGEMRLPHLYPDVDWSQAQHEFFRHPYWTATVAFYGLYRRSVLEKVGPPRSLIEREDDGLMIGTEAPLLSGVAARGRVVVIPEILFSYLEHSQEGESLAHEQADRLGFRQTAELQAKKQAKIFENALRSEAPVPQKIRLAGSCTKATIRRLLEEVGIGSAESTKDG